MSEKTQKIKENFDIKTSIYLILFLINFGGSVGSYFKTMADIKTELSIARYEQAEKLRNEFRQLYVSKDEARFIQQSLAEIKAQLSHITQKLDKK